MTKQLVSYSLLMIINVSLLWSVNVTNDILTVAVTVCTISTVPAIFVSYLLLYVNYHYLDVFVSNGVHHVFVAHTACELPDMKAEHEYVSDVENYNEEYPQQILDDNSQCSDDESTKIVTKDSPHKNMSTKMRDSLRKMNFLGKEQSLENEKVRGRWININD